MPTGKPAVLLVDLAQFESVAHAKSIIRRTNGFDDCVKQELTAAVEQSEHFNRPGLRSQFHLTVPGAS